MSKLRLLMLALVAVAGLGFAAAPSLADYGRNYRGGHGCFDHCCHHYHYHGYRPVPVARRYTPYWPGYRPVVVRPAPGFYYSGCNLSFGIGF